MNTKQTLRWHTPESRYWCNTLTLSITTIFFIEPLIRNYLGQTSQFAQNQPDFSQLNCSCYLVAKIIVIPNFRELTAPWRQPTRPGWLWTPRATSTSPTWPRRTTATSSCTPAPPPPASGTRSSLATECSSRWADHCVTSWVKAENTNTSQSSRAPIIITASILKTNTVSVVFHLPFYHLSSR